MIKWAFALQLLMRMLVAIDSAVMGSEAQFAFEYKGRVYTLVLKQAKIG